MDSGINILYLYICIVIFVFILMVFVFIYVWTFILNNRSETILLGLESMSVETYLVDSGNTVNLLTFYETPFKKPYLNISYFFVNDLVGTLTFTITDSSDVVVSTKIENKRNISNFKTDRITFTNNGSNYYKLNYKLTENINNSDNIEIVRIELKV
jgi:hypothetical protein